MIQEMESKMLSLKVDGVSKSGRCFIAINVQYVDDEGQLKVRTLAVEELLLSHTATYLKETIVRILRRYGISVKSIVSVTCDSGANYVKAAKLLDQEGEDFQIESDEDEFNFVVQCPWEIPHFELGYDDFSIQSVRCAEHTLQLAIEDGMKRANVKGLLDKVRKTVKFLRNEKQRKQLREAGLTIPGLDVVTRWGSSYDMTCGLMRLRNFMDHTIEVTLADRGTYFLTSQEWEKLEELLDDLTPVRKATTELQTKELTLGQFYAIWAEAALALKERQTELSKEIFKAMEERSKAVQYRERNAGERIPALFHYPGFNAALFLDPRYMALLTAEQVADAKKYLLELSKKLQNLRGPAALSQDEIDSDEDCMADGREPASSSCSAFSKLLEQRNRERLAAKQGEGRLQAAAISKREELRAMLDEYDRKTDPLPEKTDIFKYWQGMKLLMPELHDLAMIVEAIPATQVSVERLFSSLDFIFRPQRYNLSSANLDNIILLHANKDLVKSVLDDLHRGRPLSSISATPSTSRSTSSLSSSSSS